MARRPRDPIFYSRFVRVVKFALPILAIAVLSTVFLVQREDPFDGQLVFSDTDRNALDDGLTIHNPQITGATASSRYRISASTAVPDSTNAREVRFTELVARSEQADGASVELTGDQGTAHIASEIITVSGNVVVVTSSGYRAETSAATADLAVGGLQTARVTVSGPTGVIEAGAMRIENRDAGDGAGTKEFFFFENGVRLVHQPQVRTQE